MLTTVGNEKKIHRSQMLKKKCYLTPNPELILDTIDLKVIGYMSG